MFLTTSDITDTKRQRALLLYQAGARVREILNQLADTGEDKDYETGKKKLSEFFELQKNRRYEVYCFRQAAQETVETLDQFHTRLRTLSKNCEFKELDFDIEQQIIIGGNLPNSGNVLFRDLKYDLAAILLDGRRDEISKYQCSSTDTPPNRLIGTVRELFRTEASAQPKAKHAIIVGKKIIFPKSVKKNARKVRQIMQRQSSAGIRTPYNF